MEINQSDFDKIYDLGFISVFAPKKSNYKEVKPLLQYIIDTFEITDLSNIIVTPDSSYNPYVSLIKDIIYSALPQNPLWNGIFRIEQDEICDDFGYHGSNLDKSVFKYYFIIENKDTQIQKCNSSWVYYNNGLVKEFLDDSNKFYNKLLDIRTKFPIILMENNV